MQRTWRGFLALTVIAAAGACGDDGGDGNGDGGDGNGDAGGGAASEWARGICQIQLDYQGAITTAVNEEQVALVAAGADLEAQKQAVIVLLDAALAGTDAATEQVDQLGEPDADGGAAAFEAAADRYATVRTILEDARAQTAALPTTDPVAFEASVQQIADAIGAGFAEQSGSLPDVQTSEELRAAFAGEPACTGG